MTQNLIVSGKEYLPSAEIARRFGYTSDYVSRLARERKIVATNINRKWFVTEESVAEFKHLASLGKEVRGTAIKKQRKAERLIHEQKIKKEKKREQSQVHVAHAQSLAVVLCGAFVGLLSWTAVGNDIGVQEFANGFEESYTQVAQAIVPGNNPFDIFVAWLSTFFSQKSSVEHGVLEVTDFNPTTQSDALSVPKEHVVEFSDEVDVTFEDDGTGVVRPIFKNNTDGQEYQMLLAPTHQEGS